MKLAYPAFSELLTFDTGRIPCLVIENRQLFRSFLCDVASAIDGCRTDLVLSDKDKILDSSKYIEIITDFINFELNKKSLITKIIGELERLAVSPEHYIKTQELLAEIDQAIGTWAFSFPCDIISSKISVSTLLKAVGIELRNDYDGHRGEVEKILDYMELVREFDRDKLFITVNMRAYFDDVLIEQFMKTAISHEFRILMLESNAYRALPYVIRTTIDADLCEF